MPALWPRGSSQHPQDVSPCVCRKHTEGNRMQGRAPDLPHRRSRLQAPRGQTTGLSGTRAVHGGACGHMLQSCPSFPTPFCSGRGPQINEHLLGHLKQHDAFLNSESPKEVRSCPGQTQKGHTCAHIHHQRPRRGQPEWREMKEQDHRSPNQTADPSRP